MKTDSQLQRDVLDELAFEPSIDHAHIGVAANAGVVTLSGFVGNYAHKMAAHRAAGRVRGVQVIANELEVRFANDLRVSDEEIGSRILNMFAWDVTVPGGKVLVTVEKGRVTLSGAVEWNYQKDAADKAVGRIAGVVGVENLIEVSNGLQAGDVRERIMAAFKRSSAADATELSITAEGSTIRLGGNVHGRHERQVAERAAWGAPGVRFVEDNMVVL
jgi:osmotically-inducible protein OsmY